jgi:hypothetical protein
MAHLCVIGWGRIGVLDYLAFGEVEYFLCRRAFSGKVMGYLDCVVMEFQSADVIFGFLHKLKANLLQSLVLPTCCVFIVLSFELRDKI